jgi:hypothetical protein
VTKGLELIEQVYVPDDMEYFTLETSNRILFFSLVSLKRHRILLNPSQMSAMAEYDIAFKLWVPLIDCLFGDQSPIVTKM